MTKDKDIEDNKSSEAKQASAETVSLSSPNVHADDAAKGNVENVEEEVACDEVNEAEADEAKPSLRSIGYTFCFLFQCAWIFYVSSYFVQLLVNGSKTPCDDSEERANMAAYINHIMEQWVMMMVPISIVLPPLLPRRSMRLQIYLIVNIACFVAVVGYAVSAISHLIFTKDTLRLIFLNVNTMEIVISLVLMVCLIYLTLHRSDIYGPNAGENSDSLGIIHGSALLLVAGTAVVAAMEGDYDHGGFNVEDNCYYKEHKGTEPEDEEQDDDKGRISLDGIQRFHPWYFISFILLLHIKHYTYNHIGYLIATKARARAQQFCEQYDMTEADRDMANHKDCWQKSWGFFFSTAVYPNCCAENENSKDSPPTEGSENAPSTETKQDQENV